MWDKYKFIFEDIVQNRYLLLVTILFFKSIFNDSNYNLIFKYYYKKSGIYGFRCNITNDLYIGSAINLEKRIKEHLNGKKSNILLQRALKKYGLINFEIIIYEVVEINDLKNLYELEDYYIKKYNPTYNIRPFAQSMLGYKHLEETKLKMSLLNKGINHPLWGKKHSEETKLKMSETHKNENNPMFGKIHNLETRKKMSDSKNRKVLI
jgi:group I intron endonuclease